MSAKKVIDIRSIKGNLSYLNESIFREIYDTYFFRLLAYAKVITHSEDLAKDVVADVFLSLWNLSEDTIDIKDIESYLFSSTKRQCIRNLKKENRTFDDRNLPSDLRSIEVETPEDILLISETLQVIQNSIENLPAQCQFVFKMIKEDGLSYEDTALELGLSKNTVRNHLSRAIGQIRTDLETYFNELNYSHPERKNLNSEFLAMVLLYIYTI